MAARDLPAGTVTLMFSDIEGSTRLLHDLGGVRYSEVLDAHRRVVRETVASFGGIEVDTQGDAFFCAFPTARGAVAAAARIQLAHAGGLGASAAELRVRIGLHTGEPLHAGDHYVGIDVHRGARVMSAGHGGQVLLSERTASFVEEELPEGVVLRDLGEHRLKDLSRPQRLYDLAVEGLASSFPPLKTLSARPTNLPVQPNRLVGRERELAHIAGALHDDDVRLLTLTGAGGTGKTRLALQVGADALEEFPDGVFVVFLAATGDAQSVLSVVATTIGLREAGGQTLAAVLGDFLRPRRMLLILDNLEHLLDAAAELADLVRMAPGVKLLVTSRAPLRVAAEREYPVPPLEVPDVLDLKTGVVCDAVTLFLERARAVKADFRLDDETSAVVSEICRRVDGLPLAIELAAARIRVLAPRTLLARLDQRLKLLSGGTRDAPERQQTLRATIDWSYKLLEEEERTLLARLGVFAGTFGIDAVDAVSDTGGRLADGTLDALFALVEKSLTRRGEDFAGEPRFFLLETIREYALERLDEAGERQFTRKRHATFYAELAEASEPAVRGRDQLEWLERLEREHDNLLTAFAFGLEHDLEIALRIVGSLFRFWEIRGHSREALRHTESVLDAADVDVPAALRSRALHAAGYHAWILGDFARSTRYLQEATTMFRELDDRANLAIALTDLSWTVRETDVTAARALAAEGFDVAEALDDPWAQAFALQALAEHGPTATFASTVRRAQELYERAGDAIFAARLQGNLAYHALEEDEPERAIALNEAPLSAARRFGDLFVVASTLNNAASAQLLAGRPEAAAVHLAESFEVLGRVRSERLIAEALIILSGVHGSAGRKQEAAFFLGGAHTILEQVAAEPAVIERRIQERLVDPLRGGGAEPFVAAYDKGRRAAVDELLARAAATAPDPTERAALKAIRDPPSERDESPRVPKSAPASDYA